MLSLLFASRCALLRSTTTVEALPDFFRREPRRLFHCKVLRAYAAAKQYRKRIARAHLMATAIQRRIVGDRLGLNEVNLTGSQRLTGCSACFLGTITYCGPLTPKVDPFTPALNVFSLLIDMPAISAALGHFNWTV